MKSFKNKTVRVIGALLACAALAFGMAACSNGSGSDPQVVLVQTGTTTTTTTTTDTAAPAVTYTITFNANDGSENPATATQKFTKGEAAALKSVSSLGFSKAGFYFKGWGLTAGAATSSYADEAGYIAVEDKTLYALWSELPVFSVNTPVISRGTVTASPASGHAGTEITLTASSKSSCFAFDSFTVVDSNSNPVTVDANGKFTLPEGGVTATATFNAVQPSSPYTETESGIVTFGSWPQTLKAEDVAVDENETLAAADFTYYAGSDGHWYAKLSDKYYKVEPIEWKVLTTNYNETGKKLLHAKNIIDVRVFYSGDNGRIINGNTIKKSDYEHSAIRAFLNGLSYQKISGGAQEACDDYLNKGFLQAAFTPSEFNSIAETTVDNSLASTGNEGYACNDTSDKIFLLSLSEYGKFGGRPKGTNFAKAKSSSYTDAWWLRSSYRPGNYYENKDSTVYARFVLPDRSTHTNYVDTSDHWERKVMYWYYASSTFGVVPALCLKN